MLKLPFLLTQTSKTTLYTPFNFLKSEFFLLNCTPEIGKDDFSSFKTLLARSLKNLSSPSTTNSLRVLQKAKVLYLSKSFLHLDTGTKFTLVKPKFRALFQDFFNRNFLLISYRLFFQTLRNSDVLDILNDFQSKSVLLFNNSFSRKSYVGLLIEIRKLLVGFSSLYLKKFFLIKKRKRGFFSFFQKKVNFISFYTFLKSISFFKTKLYL